MHSDCEAGATITALAIWDGDFSTPTHPPKVFQPAQGVTEITGEDNEISCVLDSSSTAPVQTYPPT